MTLEQSKRAVRNSARLANSDRGRSRADAAHARQSRAGASN